MYYPNMTGVFKGLGIASAYCFPMSVKNEQNSFAIFTLSVHFSPLTRNVSESDFLFRAKPVMLFKTFQVLRMSF